MIRVAAQVSAEVVRPNVDRPYEGVLQISTEITPMASAVYELGRCGRLAKDAADRAGHRTTKRPSRGYWRRRCGSQMRSIEKHCVSLQGRRFAGESV